MPVQARREATKGILRASSSPDPCRVGAPPVTVEATSRREEAVDFRFRISRAFRFLTPRLTRSQPRVVGPLDEDAVRGYEEALRGWVAPAHESFDPLSLTELEQAFADCLNEMRQALSRDYDQRHRSPLEIADADSRLRRAHQARLYELFEEYWRAERRDSDERLLTKESMEQWKHLELRQKALLDLEFQQHLRERAASVRTPYEELLLEDLIRRLQRGRDRPRLSGPVPQDAEVRRPEDAVAELRAAARFSQRAEEPLTDSESAEVALTSGTTLDHALARLFLRLGPPPEATARDYEPASSGDGGAQQ